MSGILVVIDDRQAASVASVWEALAAGQQLAAHWICPVSAAGRRVGDRISRRRNPQHTRSPKSSASSHPLLTPYTADGFSFLASFTNSSKRTPRGKWSFPHTFRSRRLRTRAGRPLRQVLIGDIVAIAPRPKMPVRYSRPSCSRAA